MKVDGAVASLFWMQVNFPQLAKGIGLNEVSFIVNMESMVHRMALEVCNEPGYINHGHAGTLPFKGAPF
jgi:hypothetical protein